MDRSPARFEDASGQPIDEQVIRAARPGSVPYLLWYPFGATLVVGPFAVVGLDAWNAGLIGVIVAGTADWSSVGPPTDASRRLRHHDDTASHEEGPISRNGTRIRYDRIQSTSFSRSITERPLSYGGGVVTSSAPARSRSTYGWFPVPAGSNVRSPIGSEPLPVGPRPGRNTPRRRNGVTVFRSEVVDAFRFRRRSNRGTNVDALTSSTASNETPRPRTVSTCSE